MSGGPEARIRELSAALEPVRPVARLRWWIAAAVGVWLAAAGVEWCLGAPGPRTDDAWGRMPFVALGAGLLGMGAGATIAALASSVPGRERAAKLGWCLVALGALALVATAVAAGLLSQAPQASGGAAFAMPWLCIGRAGWLGLAPAVVLVLGAGRAFPAHRVRTGLACGIGAVLLGAVVVQASCRADGGLHGWIGHGIGPLLLGVLIAVPAGWWLRRSVNAAARASGVSAAS